jgi:hypothetical protein
MAAIRCQLTDYSAASPLVSPDGKQIACGYIDEEKKRLEHCHNPG